jgi:hypothetical protein
MNGPDEGLSSLEVLNSLKQGYYEEIYDDETLSYKSVENFEAEEMESDDE